MAQYTKRDKSSSSTSSFKNYSRGNGNFKGPTIGQEESSTGQSDNSLNELLITCISKSDKLEKQVDKIEKQQETTRNFYNSLAKFSSTTRVIVILLMFIPLLQLIACAGIVYYLGIQEKNSSLINWVLGGVSILSLGEVIIIPVKLFLLDKRMDDFEKRLDKIENDNL